MKEEKRELRERIIKKVLGCESEDKLLYIDKILTQQRPTEIGAKRLMTFEGFGEKHHGAEWASLLGVPRNSLWRYLNAGLNIEQIAKKRGVEYLPKEQP